MSVLILEELVSNMSKFIVHKEVLSMPNKDDSKLDSNREDE
jgi:hypothetical protein